MIDPYTGKEMEDDRLDKIFNGERDDLNINYCLQKEAELKKMKSLIIKAQFHMQLKHLKHLGKK